MKKRALCAVALFVFFAAGSLYAADDTVKIGVIYSITGAGSTVAKVQLDGINLAVKQVNDAGGITVKGKKVKVVPVIRDDETKPDVGVRRLREMTEEGIKVIAQAGEKLEIVGVYGPTWFKVKTHDGLVGWIFCKDGNVGAYHATVGWTAQSMFDGLVVAG
jgi:hypothetical protein